MICHQRHGHSGANNFQLFTPQGPDKNNFKQCDKCRAHKKKTYLKDKKNPLGVVNTQAKARRAATLAANIAYEQQNSVHPVSARTAFVLQQLYLTCDLCVQVNNTVLQNAADAAIKNFDAMLSSEIAKDPTAEPKVRYPQTSGPRISQNLRHLSEFCMVKTYGSREPRVSRTARHTCRINKISFHHHMYCPAL